MSDLPHVDRRAMHGAARAIVELDLVSPTAMEPVDLFQWNTARNCLIGLLISNDYEFVQPPDSMGRHLSRQIRRKACTPVSDNPQKSRNQRSR